MRCLAGLGEVVTRILTALVGVMDTTPPGRRRRTAIWSALVTSSVFWLAAMDQPTTWRVKTSRTTAKNKNPAQVGT